VARPALSRENCDEAAEHTLRVTADGCCYITSYLDDLDVDPETEPVLRVALEMTVMHNAVFPTPMWYRVILGLRGAT
jgi:hypothetical protein